MIIEGKLIEGENQYAALAVKTDQPNREDVAIIGIGFDDNRGTLMQKIREEYQLDPKNCTLRILPKDKPKIPDFGRDGNAFALLGQANTAAKKAGWSDDEMQSVMKEAKSGDYDHLIQTIIRHFEVCPTDDNEDGEDDWDEWDEEGEDEDEWD